MKYTAAVLLASAAAVSADCATTSYEEGGNWFCQAVNQIKYTNLAASGSYKAVSSMSSSGDCSFSDKAYSGAIAPFDEELSVHVRGPTQLKSFAVYKPAATKKRAEHKSHRRHGHQHLHKKAAEGKQEEARAVGDDVIATINGQVVSWKNTWDGKTAAVADSKAAATTYPAAATTAATSSKTTKAASTASTSADFDAAGDYTRVAYYSAEDQTADGITFLGNYGGQGSGVFDNTWGNSLSYLSADGTSGAASSEILSNVLVGDNKEYAIFADTECADGDEECGYARPGSVAYHGFGGADKVFLFEFQMPASGKTGWNEDMPAIWLLNAKIPRTGQYSSCSCWGNGDGCGEADVFEVLASGDTKAKSTFHFLNSLGSSDYFDRPTSKYIKLAVVFQASSETASIKIIDDSVDFASSLSATTIESFVNDDGDSLLSTIMSFLSG
ncbi:hypothetical protein JX265_011282 [Neoarthrinium moseri]|uniref:glucan endo-1,3-beta-D-glucosidase n=1 Tax=Neoarthrinium moseri TaxID=1658444 RepID=A0A9P9WCG9_9PEZI|nr:uncharacterized protein JN550_006350 [Neoarthrinium moseri]KAI1857081.1 hypothetical protein JX265_011282 [Neoarthrinium moseri]KAI1868434.1 hypothetical protein JN550_006350 [Neoarthrinium moseri]